MQDVPVLNEVTMAKPFQVGEFIATPIGGAVESIGGAQLHIAGFRNDSVQMSDGKQEYLTRVAVNIHDMAGKPLGTTLDVPVFDSRSQPNTSPDYLRRRVAEITDAHVYFDSLPAKRQRKIRAVVDSSAPLDITNEEKLDLSLSDPYLRSQKQLQEFDAAKKSNPK